MDEKSCRDGTRENAPYGSVELNMHWANISVKWRTRTRFQSGSQEGHHEHWRL